MTHSEAESELVVAFKYSNVGKHAEAQFLSSQRGEKNDRDSMIFPDRWLVLLAIQRKKIGSLQFEVNFFVAN